MNPPPQIGQIILGMLTVALVLSVYRLVRGPLLPNRVVALDLMSSLGMGILGASAVLTDEPVFIDVAIVVALVSFLGTIGFARYLEKRVHADAQEEEERRQRDA